MPLIWQLLEGHWTKDIISEKQECLDTSAHKVCVFNSSADSSLILELDSKLALWISLKIRLKLLDKGSRSTLSENFILIFAGELNCG